MALPALPPEAAGYLERLAELTATIRDLTEERNAALAERRELLLSATQYRGVTYDLIAERCGMSKANVQAQLGRARQAIPA